MLVAPISTLILSRTKFVLHISTQMICFKNWHWVITLIVLYWVEVGQEKTLMRWTSKVCFLDHRKVRIMDLSYLMDQMHSILPGKYNLIHQMFHKYQHHFTKCFRIQFIYSLTYHSIPIKCRVCSRIIKKTLQIIRIWKGSKEIDCSMVTNHNI